MSRLQLAIERAERDEALLRTNKKLLRVYDGRGRAHGCCPIVIVDVTTPDVTFNRPYTLLAVCMQQDAVKPLVNGCVGASHLGGMYMLDDAETLRLGMTPKPRCALHDDVNDTSLNVVSLLLVSVLPLFEERVDPLTGQSTLHPLFDDSRLLVPIPDALRAHARRSLCT